MNHHPQDGAGPLAGLRVIDLTQFVLGPFATQTLGDLGADILKIEDPGGDRQRQGTGKTAPEPDMGPLYVQLNRNKRSVVLDLKTEPGREKLRALIETADLFIHNMRPEAIARLGFDYAAVSAIRPDIVYVEAVGYAPEGPYAGRQAFDDLIQAASGGCDLLPRYDGEPALRPLPSLVADKACGLYAAIGALAALQHRARTGEGQFVQVPMLETFAPFMLAEHLNGESYVPSRGKLGHPTTVTPHRRPYRTKDGFVAILPSSQEVSNRFLRLGGFPDPYNTPRYLAAKDGRERVDAYYAMMNEAALTRTTAEWMELCAAEAIPAMRANTLGEALDDPHMKVTIFEERDLPGGVGRYRAMKPGLRFSKTPASIRRDPPRLGQDTQEVLDSLKG